ncbi:hypothetical protein BLA29_015021 [Euroglyphus maynei]|uniref:Uncharacterized protein n=1 Tax=Euroglyphus maynei TaxID=6958 RepID=A0A1Y3B3E9_EURMA|nr:hypothetical protein BLA29_015021 [Euroglyphus maynei]
MAKEFRGKPTESCG